MIVSYRRFQDLAIGQIDRALGNEAEMLLFFLFSQFDDRAQQELSKVAKDLNALTDDWAAAILFAPPPPSARADANSLADHANASEEPKLWSDINAEMTNNVYAIAREFSIGPEELPGILFVARDSTEFAYLHLDEGSLMKTYPRIRKIVSAWYEANEAAFEARKPSESRLHRTQSEFLEAVLIPALRRELGRRSDLSADSGSRLLRLVKRLRRHPNEWQDVTCVWRECELEIELDGRTLRAETLRSEVQDIVLQRARGGAAAPSETRLPISAIKRVDAGVRIGSLVRSANAVRDQVGGWLDLIGKLRPFFGLA